MAQQSTDTGVIDREPVEPAAQEHPAMGEAIPAREGMVEETLVEEVSIDGMCGVY